jgi:ABC-type branched-subunit amino acid transport system ATPase component
VLTDHVAETGYGILLVEHDMALVADVCTRIYVLDFGKIIYEGTTTEALDSDTVKVAYLGEVAEV